MSKRFELVQKHEEYEDYDTILGGNDAADVATNEDVRRLTIVRSETPWAYLTMADYSERDITIEAAEELLA
jgi:hypothetical protein